MFTAPAKHILIAPLDWGSGHTTRCLPLIGYLLQMGHKVTFAGNEAQQLLLLKTYPHIKTVYLEGYNIVYSRHKKGFLFAIMRQLPRIVNAIRQEQAWLQAYLKENKTDGIISDNRYGLFHREVPSVIITHQLEIQTGLGHAFNQLLRRLHYRYLNRFRACWVADMAGVPNLSGRLSHPAGLPAHATYLGLLSQMKQNTVPDPGDGYLMVLLSGPEPQRSIFSDLLWDQVMQYPGKVVFVEGTAAVAARQQAGPHIAYYPQLNAADLQLLLQGAGLVICRSGYSTLMDLVLLGKKALLIPTPGQTEQEYLAGHLQQQGIFPAFTQHGFRLEAAIAGTADFPFHRFPFPAGAHRQFAAVLDRWLASL